MLSLIAYIDCALENLIATDNGVVNDVVAFVDDVHAAALMGVGAAADCLQTPASKMRRSIRIGR